MAKKRTWTDEQLIIAVQNNHSIAGVIGALGLVPAGGNYQTISRHIRRLQLDTSHFTGQRHLKGKANPWVKRRPLSEILVENSDYTTTHHLRIRLIKEHVLINSCYECGISTWQGKPLSLHLDHINGVRTDNRIENLRLLCPNCHSQTPTYAGKNKGSASTTLLRD